MEKRNGKEGYKKSKWTVAIGLARRRETVPQRDD